MPFHRHGGRVLALGVLLLVCTSCKPSWFQDEESVWLAKVTKYGGIDYDETLPSRPIVQMTFDSAQTPNAPNASTWPMELAPAAPKPPFTDADLAWLSTMRLQGKLAGLQFLSLRKTAITDKGLEHLKGLPQLTELDLSDTGITDAGVKRLVELLPQLTRLNFDNCQLTAAGFTELQRLKYLTSLDVDGITIAKPEVTALGQISSLTCLSLGSDQLTDDCLEQLTGLVKMERLFINGGNVCVSPGLSDRSGAGVYAAVTGA